jgi:hypothetical protein
MSTQRRVVRRQRLANMDKVGTELAGTAIPSSYDAGGTGPLQEFRRVAVGLTAPLSSPLWYGMTGLATNSLSFSSCCEWVFLNSACGLFDEEADTNGSDPAPRLTWHGNLPEQLPSTSPLLSGASELEQSSARIMQSALPRVPTGRCPGTERQHGQGNLYLQYAARNAACDSGR